MQLNPKPPPGVVFRTTPTLEQWIENAPSLIFAVVWLGWTVWLVAQLFEGHTSRFAAPSARIGVLLWMVLFGLLYYNLEKTAFKLFIGIAEIAVALASNYVQLGGIAIPGSRASTYDRLALFVGGVIVFSKGIKDVVQGWEKFHPRPGHPAPADDSD